MTEATASPEPAAALLSEEDTAAWWARINAAEKKAEEKRDRWKKNVQAYMGEVLDRLPDDDVVNVPMEFAYVELKKSQLAFQVPEVHLAPKRPGLESAVLVFQAAVNHELGPEGANVGCTLEEITADVLLCGIGASKIGYSAEIRQRPRFEPQTGPDGMPLTGPDGQPAMAPAIDPATGQPAVEDYVASERYFWDRFEPEDLLIDPAFRGSDFDKAAWLGIKFRLDWVSAQRQFGLDESFAGIKTEPKESLSGEQLPDQITERYIEGYEIWRQTHVYDPNAGALPGQYSCLVFLKGRTEPVKLQDSPYQWIGADGQIMGMKGNPIHPVTLRFLPGSAYPKSDVAMGIGLSAERSKGRTQMIRFRDRALPMRWFDRTGLTPEQRDKIASGDIMATIGVDGNGHEKIGVIALPSFPRTNYENDDIIRRDYEQTWAMAGPQTGLTEPESKTATEVQLAQGASDVRLDKERTQLLKWFVKGATKFASLLQQFKDTPGYVNISGDEGAQQIVQWDRQSIAGEYVFTAKPDSALRIDAHQKRRELLALYNLGGNDPNVNRVEILKMLIRAHNLDPAKIVVEQLPPKGPEPPKVSLSIKGEDLAPNAPQSPIVMALLAQAGYQIPPEAIQNAGMLAQRQQEETALAAAQKQAEKAAGKAPAPHGGPMTPMTPINKHQLDRDAGKLTM